MHTDSSEKGRVRWARVKGATENELLRLFKFGYMLRPGAMTASRGQKNLKLIYKIFDPMIPVFKLFIPDQFLSLEQVGRAMINCAERHPDKHVLEIADIRAMST